MQVAGWLWVGSGFCFWEVLCFLGTVWRMKISGLILDRNYKRFRSGVLSCGRKFWASILCCFDTDGFWGERLG